MIAMLMSLVMAMVPFAQTAGKDLPFDIRADKNLVLGVGEKSAETYYDVIITREAAKGVMVKLPYTQKGGKFTFDLHHRVALVPNFADAEITTIIEVINGGGTSVGVYTLIDKVNAASKFDEAIVKVSAAEVDRYITALSHKSISIDTVPGPQTLSIVGKTSIVTRGASSTRIDTPGVRIAAVSKMKFAEATTGTRLSVDKD
jgi:hypothetical protein